MANLFLGMSFENVVSDPDCHLPVFHILIRQPIIGPISKRRRSLPAMRCDLENQRGFNSNFETDRTIMRRKNLELDRSRWEKRIKSMEGSEVD